MSTKFLIFVLSTFLLVQFVHGNAIGKKTEASTSSEGTNKIKDNGSSEELQEIASEVTSEVYATIEFYTVARTEMLNFVDSIYNTARAAFEPLIANISATENATKSKWEENLQKIKQLYEKRKNLNVVDQSEKSNFIDEFFKTFDNFKGIEEPTANLSQFDKGIIKVIDNLKPEVLKIFTTTSDHLIAAMEKYWSSLSPKTQQEQKAVHDTYVRAKSEPDPMKKFTYLVDFFSSADSSEGKQ